MKCNKFNKLKIKISVFFRQINSVLWTNDGNVCQKILNLDLNSTQLRNNSKFWTQLESASPGLSLSFYVKRQYNLENAGKKSYTHWKKVFIFFEHDHCFFWWNSNLFLFLSQHDALYGGHNTSPLLSTHKLCSQHELQSIYDTFIFFKTLRAPRTTATFFRPKDGHVRTAERRDHSLTDDWFRSDWACIVCFDLTLSSYFRLR